MIEDFSLTTSAPGRICLFGEHQDYLHLPVIPMAINLRVSVSGKKRTDKKFILYLQDINKTYLFTWNNKEMPYSSKRDYFISCMNILFRQGYRWNHGWDIIIRGNIPINSGTSSSSALNNAWLDFLIKACCNGDKVISPEKIAEWNYRAEVLEFNEAGGMMDQYSSALGNILFLEFEPHIKAKILNYNPGSFILADSGEPKDTQHILSKTKIPALSAMAKITKRISETNIHELSPDMIAQCSADLTDLEYKIILGMIKNRDITFKALCEFESDSPSQTRIGELLTQQQEILDKTLNISTPKINRMIQTALSFGALGAKINGSGGGGCMFAYAPQNSNQIAEELMKISKRVFIIEKAPGINPSLG